MKNFILGVLLGTFILKASQTTYTYYWWKAESLEVCLKRTTLDCMEKNMGPAVYLKYINYNLLYSFRGWELRY